MDQAGYSADQNTIISLIEIFTHKGRLDLAIELFSSLRWPKFDVPLDHPSVLLPPPNRAIHVAMVKAFCQTGRWGVALSLVSRMQAREQPFLSKWQLECMAPPRLCYTLIIGACVDEGDLRSALEVVRDTHTKTR